MQADMATYAHAANPRVLRWARENAGRTLDEVAQAVGKTVEVIAQWETDAEERQVPTFGQLDDLAGLYRLPIAVFFFPEPPVQAFTKPEFRTLPKDDPALLVTDTRFAIREAIATQESLRTLTDGENPSRAPIVGLVVPEPRERVSAFCERVRAHLGVSMEAQALWRSADEGFRQWRKAIQMAGVFVFKRPFNDEDISGFCLHDDEFPVVIVNSGMPPTRQTFTLFHELAHLLVGVNGVTKEDTSYVDRLPETAKKLEVLCNRIAAELLMPEADFDQHLALYATTDDAIEGLSKRYSVSREAVMRRLLDKRLVAQEAYERRRVEWILDAKLRKQEASKKARGLYYPTQASRLGDAFLRVAFGAYRGGRCTLPELSGHLRMKAANVLKLEEHLTRRRS
jgi:Zn-dependent peptidase ImmA (M78 family)